ncbi:Peptidase S53 domain-containing protein [Balamuthia mandrillaris]
MKTACLLVVLSLLAVAAATAAPSPRLLLKSQPVSSPHWQPLLRGEEAAAGRTAPLTLYAALKERNLEYFEKLALAIADPDSPAYGRQLSLKEVTELTAPEQESVDQVVAWLSRHGVTDYEVMASRSFIRFKATVEQAERLLNCQFRTFSHVLSPAKTVLRCHTPSFLEEGVHPLIDFIEPVHGFPRLKNVRDPSANVAASNQKGKDKNVNVTPTLIRQIYNVTVGTPNLGVNNTQAVWEDQDDYSTSDLQKFFRSFAPNLVGQKVVKDLGDAENDPHDPGEGEAALDLQYIMAMGSFCPTYYYLYKEDDIFDAFLRWVTDLASDPRPPLIHSVSYGEYGGDYPNATVQRISNEWMKLGARGVSILVASGDDGVGCNDNCTKFEFPYPSSPWITLVGGTVVKQNSSGQKYEVGWDGSSGGFSADFSIPSWQAADVAYYLKNAPNLPTSYFNGNGRGLPDISAPADYVQIVLGGYTQSIGGTSCSAPILSGLFSLINGYRIKANKSPLGYLNPMLYALAKKIPAAYHDITEGSNPDGCCPGFPCYKGWDPVTGLGTPNFGIFLQFAMSLP